MIGSDEEDRTSEPTGKEPNQEPVQLAPIPAYEYPPEGKRSNKPSGTHPPVQDEPKKRETEPLQTVPIRPAPVARIPETPTERRTPEQPARELKPEKPVVVVQPVHITHLVQTGQKPEENARKTIHQTIPETIRKVPPKQFGNNSPNNSPTEFFG